MRICRYLDWWMRSKILELKLITVQLFLLTPWAMWIFQSSNMAIIEFASVVFAEVKSLAAMKWFADAGQDHAAR